MDRVTVLIPTYNRSKYITEAVNSCLVQKNININIIIYDDGSTDGTSFIIDGLIKSNPGKIKYIRSDKNLGIGNARNVLLENMETEYGCWLDSDDKMHPDRLFRSLVELKKGYDMIYCGINSMDANGNLTRNTISVDVKSYKRGNFSTLKNNTVCATCFFNKNAKSIKFEKLRLGGEDVLWLYNCINAGFKIGYVNDFLYYYRNHGERIGVIKRKPQNKQLKEAEDALVGKKLKEIQNNLKP